MVKNGYYFPKFAEESYKQEKNDHYLSFKRAVF